MTSFQEIVREKVPLLGWNPEIFNSLKQPFFPNQEKKSKPFKRLLFLRKQEKNLNDDFSLYL